MGRIDRLSQLVMFYSLDAEQKELIIDIKKIAHPDLAPQNFNPRSLTIES
jgi:hypothetical protein